MQNPSYIPTHDGSLYTYVPKGGLPASPAPPQLPGRPAGLVFYYSSTPRTSSRLTTHTHPSIARISCTPWAVVMVNPAPNAMVQALSVWLPPCVCFVFADQIDAHACLAWPDCLVHGDSRGKCLEAEVS